MIYLFSDGGTVGKNPSKIGGTWAFVAVTEIEGIILGQFSGLIEPRDIELSKISSNFTELYAAVRGLRWTAALSKTEPIILHTDSIITLHRMKRSKKFKGIPEWLMRETLKIRKRLTSVVLLGGHPTREDLKRGCRANGRPVSKYNVMCDLACNQAAEDFI